MARNEDTDEPAGDEKVLVQSHVSPAMAQKIKERAAELEVSHAAVLRMALAQFFAAPRGKR